MKISQSSMSSRLATTSGSMPVRPSNPASCETTGSTDRAGLTDWSARSSPRSYSSACRRAPNSRVIFRGRACLVLSITASRIALIGASPVPPAMQSRSRFPCGGRGISPRGRPRRAASPGPARGIGDRIAPPLPGPARHLYVDILARPVGERLVGPDGEYRDGAFAPVMLDHLAQPPRRLGPAVLLCCGMHGDSRILQRTLPCCFRIDGPLRPTEMLHRRQQRGGKCFMVFFPDAELAMVLAELAQECGAGFRRVHAPYQPGESRKDAFPQTAHRKRKESAEFRAMREKIREEVFH